MKAFSKRAVLGVLSACLALGLAAAGCGDKFSTDKCKDLPEASVCAGAGLQRCGATDPEVCAPNADGCLVWSAGVPCAADQTCSQADGQCRCSNTCSAVGGTECNGTVIRTCQASAAGCLAWVNGEDCAAGGQVCDEGSGAAQCAATCTDACSPAGTRRCATGVIQGCGQEASGCLGWIDLQDCAAEDASCVVVDGEPTCAENCQDECVAAEYPQCDVANNARLTCSTQIDGCTDLVTTPCGAGNVCDPALDPPACVLDCTGQCTLGETACGADGFSLDVCSAVADACNAVVNTPCEANQICDATAVPPVCIACTPDCAGKVCGPDGCGGECGPGCVLPQVCNADGTACEGCVPDCAGKVCGDDGCGGSCGSCGADETCAEDQASCDCTGGPDAIVDGSFETGGTWTEYSSAYGTPLCTYPGCGQSNVAVEGVYWIWMGGGDADDAYVEQAVTIPAANIATLWFYLYAGGATAGDFFEVTLDGTQVVQYAVEDPIYGETWHLMEVDVSAYADGAAHTLRLHGTVSAGGSVMLDVVQLITCAGGGCTNDCNPALFPACNANGNLDTCVMQGDGCTDLFSTPCEAGLSCQGAAGSAECLAGCADDCVAANFPACSADLLAIETCADTDADGCTELTTTACNAGEACDASSGTPTCVPAVQRVDITVWDFEASSTAPSVGAGTATAGAGLTVPGSGEFPTGFGGVGFSWTRDGWTTATPEDVTDYFAFAVDLTGRTQVLFSFDERRSNTGVRELNLAYSLDGTTFTAVPGSITPLPDDANWRSWVFDLSALVDNQASVTVRVYGYLAEGAAGTWRIDNVAFRGL